MSKILLESFRTAYANMDLSPPITPKEVENFRVEYGTEVLEELEQLVEDDPSGSGKIIFTGHRGCGKWEHLNHAIISINTYNSPMQELCKM